jgi:hypothetical protein
MSISAPVNATVMARFEILPIDDEMVIVVGSRVMGTEPAFVRLHSTITAYFGST